MLNTNANDRQVAGQHYAAAIQHWDFAASQQFDYFQGQITKYVTRWKKKNGLDDLLKAQHFLEKYIELESERLACEPGPGYVNQDPDVRPPSRLGNVV